jgi:hypothetical protein
LFVLLASPHFELAFRFSLLASFGFFPSLSRSGFYRSLFLFGLILSLSGFYCSLFLFGLFLSRKTLCLVPGFLILSYLICNSLRLGFRCGPALLFGLKPRFGLRLLPILLFLIPTSLLRGSLRLSFFNGSAVG